VRLLWNYQTVSGSSTLAIWEEKGWICSSSYPVQQALIEMPTLSADHGDRAPSSLN
jgi:hypothetical protein